MMKRERERESKLNERGGGERGRVNPKPLCSFRKETKSFYGISASKIDVTP